MTEPDDRIVEATAELIGGSMLEVTATEVQGSVTVGDQSLALAETRIKVETAAHQRQIEKQKLDHRLREEEKDNHFGRWKDIITFAVVIIGIVVLMLGSFIVAATTSDPTRQVWAQGFATSLAGAIGGAFAGYAAASKR